MKKTLLFIALVLCAGNFAFAQASKSQAGNANVTTTKNPQERLDKRLENLTRVLNLTQQQQESVKQIFMQGNAQLKAGKAANDKEKANQIKRGMEQQIEALLTPDQKLKFQKAMADRKAKNRENQKN